jgi:hypothetical protein
MQIDTRAPVVARHQIEIFAPPDKVWDWLSRVEMWPSWRQDVSSAHWVNGGGANGIFKWRLRSLFGFTAQVQTWDAEREFSFRCSSYGSRLLQVIRVRGDLKNTSVTSDMSIAGGLVRFPPARYVIREQMCRSVEIWFGALKTKLEAGKGDSMRPPRGVHDPFSNNVKLPSERDRLGS